MTHVKLKAASFGALVALLVAPLWAADPAQEAYTQGHQAYRADDYQRAMQLLLPLAQQGHAGAQYDVARMYEKGEGVDKDEKQTVEWYRRSAEGGNPRAQYKLFAAYARGWGPLKKDEAVAREWLTKAAEGGYGRAQETLGKAYEKGKFGLPRDRAKADYWKKKGGG